MLNKDIFLEKFGEPVRYGNGGSELIFVCPKCGKKALSCSLTKGVFYCFVCSFGKGEKVDGIATKSVLPDVDKKAQNLVIRKAIEIFSLDKIHRIYLEERGIDADKYQLKSVPFRAGELLLEYFDKETLLASGCFAFLDEQRNPRASSIFYPGTILIPYWHGDDFVTLKGRTNPYNESEIKYSAPRSADLGKYIFYKEIHPGDAIITEGEFKAMAGMDHGLFTIGLSGMNMKSDTCLRQIKKITKNRRRFIIFDTEKNHPEKRETIVAATSLASKLDACILFLPSKPGVKMDLDSYLKDHTGDELQLLLNEAWCTKDEDLRAWQNSLL